MKVTIELDECDMDYMIDALNESLSRIHPSSVRHSKYLIDRIEAKRNELKEMENKIYKANILRFKEMKGTKTS